MTALDHHEDRRPKGLLAVITGAIVVGIAATVLGLWNAVGLARESDTRERERISADLAACERGNVLRGQVVDVGDAGEDLVAGVLDVVFGASSSPERVAALREDLEPVFEKHRDAVDAIRFVDCAELIAGNARPSTLPTTTTEEPNP